MKSIDHRGMFSYHASLTTHPQLDGTNGAHEGRTLKQPWQNCESDRQKERPGDTPDNTGTGVGAFRIQPTPDPAEPRHLAQRCDVAERAGECEGGQTTVR